MYMYCTSVNGQDHQTLSTVPTLAAISVQVLHVVMTASCSVPLDFTVFRS